MSYDLSFYTKKDNPVSKNEIAAFLDRLPAIFREDETWSYENENTGAYCSFEFYERDETDEELEAFEGEHFEEFQDTGFSFNINFIRPQFFGKECFPLVDRMAEELDLYIFNPQQGEMPQKYEKGVLEKEWGDANLKFAGSQFKQFGLCYLDLEKSNYAWEYSMMKEELQHQLGDEYFVPRIFYINKKESSDVVTVSVWPEHIPYVLPRVDYIVVQKKIMKLFRSKKVDELVTYDQLVQQLGGYFEDKGMYKILHPENADKIENLFNTLPSVGGLNELGEGVPIQKIVNSKGG